jgi:hypothetical protein
MYLLYLQLHMRKVSGAHSIFGLICVLEKTHHSLHTVSELIINNVTSVF